MIKPRAARFGDRLLAWFDQHGRKDLPWQQQVTSYRVWVSEIMLQQTQVATVKSYFLRFVERFPRLADLAAADNDDVMALWSGLGYYSRARNLHQTARLCVDQHAGELPDNLDELVALPGIGRSTAGAILALSMGQRQPILDGNVKRVLTRFFAVDGWPGKSAVSRKLWQLAVQQTPEKRVADYTQAIMDLGAVVCTSRSPDCLSCPLVSDCLAHARGHESRYPERRPRKPLPEREAVMLVARDGSGRILLQRRPPSGIWGGLWSLPQYESLDTAQGFLNGRAEARAENIIHTFSHFRLRATPWRFRPNPDSIADRDDLRWFDRSEMAKLGLPKPVRDWTRNLFEETIQWQEK